MVCVQAVVEKKKFRVQSKNGKRREMRMYSLSLVFYEVGVGQGGDKTISDLQ